MPISKFEKQQCKDIHAEIDHYLRPDYPDRALDLLTKKNYSPARERVINARHLRVYDLKIMRVLKKICDADLTKIQS